MVLSAWASSTKLAIIADTVVTLGQSREKPSVNLRPIAHPTSRSPAMTKYIHAIMRSVVRVGSKVQGRESRAGVWHLARRARQREPWGNHLLRLAALGAGRPDARPTLVVLAKMRPGGKNAG